MSRTHRPPEEVITVGLELPESGAPAGLCLQVIGEGVFGVHRLPATGALLIGRAADSDICIPDPAVSRQHARLHLGPPLSVENLRSVNGIRVRGRQLSAGETSPLAVNEPIEIGTVMLIVQQGAAERRPRRVWSHDAFEARLEGECSRGGTARVPFSVLRLRCASSHARELLASHLRPVDVLAAYGPGEYEIILIDVDPAQAAALVGGLTRAFEERKETVRVGLASFGVDGRTPEALIQRATAALHGPANAGSAARQVVILDPGMVTLYQLIDRVAPSALSVLLLGETGVGKEIIAEAIHRRSRRAEKPFVRLNCAALTESLLESELFGHQKGSFTGADRDKRGLLESAAGGTVFLDEVGELPMGTQVKLLRVLEERAVRPVGAIEVKPIDVRFLAATNRNLDAEIERGAFRQDLFFRLNGITLNIPPLRERQAELEALIDAFVSEAARQVPRAAPRVSAEALAQLRAYPWPGNLRELRNVLERATLLCAGDEITPEHLPAGKIAVLPAAAPRAAPQPVSVGSPTGLGLKEELEALERQRVLDALQACGGNQTRAAKALGISRNTLLARLGSYGVPRPRKAT